MIQKDLAQIAIEDLQHLCDQGWIEDEQIDFKETIPHKDGASGDPWRDERRIKEHGRDQLLAAIVAFANSYGGDLIVGIAESGGKPGRAERLSPVPACQDAAHRLAQAANACIDPPLSNLKVQAVVMDEAGNGALILRTGRSRSAPHRLSTTKECYHRVRHETLPMSMRQIQDLTFKVARGLDAIDRRRSELRHEFRNWLALDQTPSAVKRVAYRITCVPSDPECRLDRVHGIQDIKPQLATVQVQARGNNFNFGIPNLFSLNFRPTLRGTQAGESLDMHKWRIQLHCDGAITYEFSRDTVEAQDDAAVTRHREHVLFPEYLFGTAINAFNAADRFRSAAGASIVEYACDIEIVTTHKLPAPYLGQTYDAPRCFDRGTHVFPAYVFGPLENRNDTLSLMWRDFWHALGTEYGDSGLQVV
jgi:hypothetical protein